MAALSTWAGVGTAARAIEAAAATSATVLAAICWRTRQDADKALLITTLAAIAPVQPARPERPAATLPFPRAL